MKNLRETAADKGLNVMNDIMMKMSNEDKMRLLRGFNFLVQTYRSGVPTAVADTIIAISARCEKAEQSHLKDATFALEKVIDMKEAANKVYDAVVKTPERN